MRNLKTSQYKTIHKTWKRFNKKLMTGSPENVAESQIQYNPILGGEEEITPSPDDLF